MKQIHQTENKLCASVYNATNQANIHILIQLTYLISLNKGVIRINCMHIMFVFYNSQELLYEYIRNQFVSEISELFQLEIFSTNTLVELFIILTTCLTIVFILEGKKINMMH